MNINVDKQKQIRLYQILLGIILFLFLYIFISRVLPEFYSFFDLITEYSVSSDLLEEESKWKENSTILKRDINKLNEQIESINLNIPSSKEISTPLNLLDNFLSKNNIKLQKLQIIAIDSAKQYQFVKLKINVKSMYKNLKLFIKDIENSSVIFTVKSLNMNLSSLYRRELESEFNINIVLKR